MSRARLRALTTASLIAALAVLLFAAFRWSPDPPAKRPTLLLLTSLPLMFGEEFSVQSNGSPALKALQSRYSVVPISVTDATELAKGRILLMAQPRAQPPEDLVALDDWVRSGGRLILLADPLLEWPSERPLGDALRPPAAFADTGLLGHWGLRLDAPDERGPKPATIAGYRVATVSPGQLYGECAISDDRIVARCRVGRGVALIVADADFLNTENLGASGSGNLEALLAAIRTLE